MKSQKQLNQLKNYNRFYPEEKPRYNICYCKFIRKLFGF